MSKYDRLWEYIKNSGQDKLSLSYDDIEKIAALPLDHSFLGFKKELLQYGYRVGKISMKEKNVMFERTDTAQ